MVVGTAFNDSLSL